MSDVLLRVEGACGRITLNRPRVLNSLTLEMVRGMTRALVAWEADSSVVSVLVDGAGERGLCAGGDIRALYDNAITNDLQSAAEFFREEYRLNALIARYSKPYIVFMDGIVMGGGVGISAHGSHRVVTGRSSIAMPEAALGFLTDIGATYLLGKAPGESGTCMALTGCRVGAADAIFAGLADFHVDSEQLIALREELVRCEDGDAVDGSIRSFATLPPSGKLESESEWVDACFAKSGVEEIVQSLLSRHEPEALAAAVDIGKAAPTALKVTLQALRNGRRYKNLGDCLAQEYNIATALIRHGDFAEGVRAALIDKDHHPRWTPARLDEVTAEMVNSYFAPAPPV